MANIDKSQYQIDGMLTGITEAFKANIKYALLAKLKADLADQLEDIAEKEAARIVQCVATYYHNPMDMCGVMQLRLNINGKETSLDSN